MLKEEADLLVSQLRAILLNQPVDRSAVCDIEELKELQSGILYLADSMEEFQTFLQKICQGELQMETPGKENFLASYLKELHAILRHLTWQATKVAEGDYKQRVTFLGDFSTTFNKMIVQLEEREIALREQSEELSETTRLLETVMNQQEEQIMVVDRESESFLFVNESAQRKLYNLETGRGACGKRCELLDTFLSHKGELDFKGEYYCERKELHLSVKGVPLKWAKTQAYAYFISDITAEIMEKSSLENMAYSDPLTSLYNRRFCLKELNKLHNETISYSLILADLDCLKTVNDNFGHEAGDDYIQTVAGLLEGESRMEDAICRIGGDEFVIIWKKCPKDVAKRKMTHVSKLLKTLGKPYSMSISYGLVYVDAENIMEPEILLKKADEKMYRMKKRNKNVHKERGQLPYEL